ncbi:recombinase family protein [Kutzneria viridogrisea]|uniref:DNA invertase Pin-like site-specific DNA recombinase n=1 Tax=Kutzneria viridogrisea TaxID=47990 RepID=A0ABR6BGR1_9PSEU|nr:DNA invertase Pin-like site-specific DNA recombinase [Kutzneria viridogrisea]
MTVTELFPAHPLVTPEEQRGTRAVIYLRLSDLREDQLTADGTVESFEDREQQLRKLAARLGWTVVDVVQENDLARDKNGKSRGVSAFKRKRITLPDGSTAMRVVRPGFRKILDGMSAGRWNALLAEDLDRTMRDPRDLEDFIDIAESRKINARSMSGSLSFTDGGTDGEISMARIMVTMANKDSRNTSRRVREGKRRQAQAGRPNGGVRRFGFEPDGITIRPAEAEIIRDCSIRVLQIDQRTKKMTSLRSLAAELRAANVPTVTGAKWTSIALRAILLRPRNAGIMVHQGEEIGRAPWEAIVPEDTFRAVVGLLTDPSRTHNPGAPATWLGSGIYLCGVCDDGETTCNVKGGSVQAEDGTRSRDYRCKEHAHLKRKAAFVDALVCEAVIAELSRPDAIDLIPQIERSTVDLPALRAEATRIRANLDEMAADRARGLIDRAQLIAGTEAANKRLAEINDLLSLHTAPSPLTPLIGVEDVAAEWAAQPTSVQRAILDTLFEVTILPTSQRGHGFDPESVRIVPKAKRQAKRKATPQRRGSKTTLPEPLTA